MTKRELSDFFGHKYTDAVSRCFMKAEDECVSIKQKKNHYNRNMEVDYTLEETLIALKYWGDVHYKASKISPLSPATIQVLKENFIHRDVPYKLKEKKIKLTNDHHNFITKYLRFNFFSACVCCSFLDARCMNRIGNPSPYCSLYGCFLNKVKPKRNIYEDKCESFIRRKKPILFTQEGVKTLDDILKKKVNSDMMGIPQSSFKSKRKRDEPITILKDGFDTDY